MDSIASRVTMAKSSHQRGPIQSSEHRWAFVECTEVYAIKADFAAKVEAHFNTMIDKVAPMAALRTSA